MYIIQFGGYVLPEQYEMAESQGAAKRLEMQALGGLGGSLRLAGLGTSPLVADSISKRFVVVSDSAANLQTALDNLLNELHLSQQDRRQGAQLLVARLPDGSLRCAFAECTQVNWSQEYYHFQNYWLGPVDIVFQRAAPRWYTYADLAYLGDHWDFADLEVGGDLDDTTWGQGVAGQTVATSPLTFTIANNGKQPVTEGILEFNGAITNPVLLNNRNGHQVSYTGTLTGTDGAGDRLTVNISTFEIKLNGARQAQSALAIGSARGQVQPMVLEPGDNEFTLTSTAPNCTFRFYFARTWL